MLLFSSHLAMLAINLGLHLTTHAEKEVEILLALIWVGGRGTIKSRTRTFVVLQLVTNVAAFSRKNNISERVHQ
jgi:hypothetical protein